MFRPLYRIEKFASRFAGAALLLIPLAASGQRDRDRDREEDKVVDELGFSRAPYVQQATPTGMHVLWRTVEGIDARVRYGVDVEKLTQEVEEEAIRVRRIAGHRDEVWQPEKYIVAGPRGTRQYEAEIAGLESDTTYYYAIYDGEKRLTPEDASYHFHTSPAPGESKDAFFWVVGDSGTGEKRQSEVHQAMLDYTEKIDRPIDFVLHVGDMAYENGTDKQFQEHFFDMYETTLRQTVVWPAMGNHEGRSANGKVGLGVYFDAYLCPTRGESGGVGSGNESYYSFDYGDIHFVVLNSFDVNRTDDGAMASWLKEDLGRVRANWLVAYWHHPPYSKGSHDTDIEDDSIEMRSQIMPILESHGVDLVLTGHSHIYERSMLMDGAYDTPTTVEGVILDDGDGDPAGDGPYRKLPGLEAHQGTVQVVAGNGGTDVERMATMPVMKRVLVENGSVLISIKGDVLDGVMINFQGEERDRFQLRKEPGVIVTRVENPRVLPPYVPAGDALPRDYVELIPRNDTWAYFTDAETLPDSWTGVDFDDGSWARGKAGFAPGEGEGSLPVAAGERAQVYVRHAFTLPERTKPEQLGLGIRYDDNFIAYVNGHEIIRHGVGEGRGASARALSEHDLGEELEYFSLKGAAKHLTDGVNVIAIEAHSFAPDNPDFMLDPFLIEKLESDKAEGEAPPLLVKTYVPSGALWRYSLAQSFEEGWEKPGFDDSAWERDRTPMGYGLRVTTSLEDMQDTMTRVRLRRKFTIAHRDQIEKLGLQVTWDDGFIAYVNGHEIGRGGVARGSGEDALGLGKTGRPSMRYFPLKWVEEHLKVGPNLIAIEGHNQSKDSSDYYIDPTVEKHWPRSWERVPKDFDEIIPRDANWDILLDDDPDEGWTVGEGGEGWVSKRTPIGYAYRNLQTELRGMRDRFQRVYLKKTFTLDSAEDRTGTGLFIAWDDAFIAYLNGEEILRVGVESGSGRKAREIYNVGGARYGFFPLDHALALWKVGEENTLAIEGHNHTLGSGDFVVDPMLIRIKPSTEAEDLPEKWTALVPQHALWRYQAGGKPPEQWNSLEFDASSWLEGKVGLGYGDDDDETELDEMKDAYTAVYVRKVFKLAEPSQFKRVALAMRWDDGFIAYLNGHEIIRENVEKGRGEEASDIRSIEVKKKYKAFPLAPFAGWFRTGDNVLAIEGHNVKKGSSDFSLDPFILEADWGGDEASE